MKADTRPSVISAPRMDRTFLSRRGCGKMRRRPSCWCAGSSLVLHQEERQGRAQHWLAWSSLPTCKERSMRSALQWLVLDPNQISWVLAGFSCKRLGEHTAMSHWRNLSETDAVRWQPYAGYPSDVTLELEDFQKPFQGPSYDNHAHSENIPHPVHSKSTCSHFYIQQNHYLHFNRVAEYSFQSIS